jgi:N6-L-threonylcarbamoyladenine synthase
LTTLGARGSDKKLVVLGIETSCDETAAAVVDETGHVFSDVVHSQIALHAGYGGVIPELAARDHIRHISRVVEAALTQAGRRLDEIDRLAVTARPGLAGALLVGTQFARSLAFASGKPLIAVDHLMGHLLAGSLRYPDLARDDEQVGCPFPFVALLASGGHTAFYRVDGPVEAQVEELGATRDDAAGECFDKAAKLLGLGYPGGPIIDRLAAVGNPKAVRFPKPMLVGDSLELSFSGIKTFLAQHLERQGPPADDAALADLAASFQFAVVEVLARKLVTAARLAGVSRVVLGGGVAANRGLRARVQTLAEAASLTMFVPPPRACTDNAAMIAYAGAMAARDPRGAADLDAASSVISPETRTRIPRVTRKGRGPRTSRPKTV